MSWNERLSSTRQQTSHTSSLHPFLVMSNKCARCGKTVYPTEELKCLDKLWHKVCFKCDECGMALSMKNYKGFNKIPYCNTHYPHMKPTNVTETPESRRLAENTRLQSQVKYHEDFERAKGKVTQVADDPETVRILNAHRIISNAAYHGDIQRKKQMDEKRVLVSADPSVHQQTNGLKIDSDRPSVVQQSLPHTSLPPASTHLFPGNKSAAAATPPPQQQELPKYGQQHRLVPQDTQSDVKRQNQTVNSSGDQNAARFHVAHQTQSPVHQSESRPPVDQMTRNAPAMIYNSGSKASPTYDSSVRTVGSIADYDPLNDNYGSIATGFRAPEPTFSYFGPGAANMQQQQQMLNMQQQHLKDQQMYYLQQQQQQHMHQQQQMQRQQMQQQLYEQQLQQQHLQHMHQQNMQQQHLRNQQRLQQQQQQQQQQQPQQSLGYQTAVGMGMRQGVAFTVRAIYDYKAQDDDEVSFMDGDLIIGCVPIDEGWMTGTVQRTGQRGMLPSNYVEVAP